MSHAGSDSGRRAALKLLLLADGRRVDLSTWDREDLPASDQKVAQEIALGVRRNLLLVDAVLRTHLRGKLKSLEPGVREALRIGIYDLLLRDRVRSPVVVDECVNLVGKGRAKRGLVNAILRAVSSSAECVHVPELECNSQTAWTAENRWIRFASKVFPSHAEDPVGYYSTTYSLTPYFVTTFLHELPLEFTSLFRSTLVRPCVTLRPTAKTATPEALAARLRTLGATELEILGPVVVLGPGQFDCARALLNSYEAVVQDLVASEVVPFASLSAGDTVLDLCAPPGGKTLQLAEAVGPEGRVVAAHLGSTTSKLLTANVERSRLRNIVLHDLTSLGTKLPEETFDHVLVDAPCSNTGVLMKRVDARYRVDPSRLHQLEKLQLQLLARGASRLRQGGSLIYSTCSILHRENRLVVSRFLEQKPAFEVVEERLRYPHRTARDGGYMARLLLRGK